MTKDVLDDIDCYCSAHYNECPPLSLWRKCKLFVQCMYYLTVGAIFHRDKYTLLMRIADSIDTLHQRDMMLAEVGLNAQ